MTYKEYIHAIAFQLVQPKMKMSRGFGKILRFFQWIGIDLEILNTRLPDFIPGLKKLNTMPKMSSYAIGAMINRAVAQMKDGSCFVNIGVWHGYSFLSGLLGNEDKRCVGVDNFSQFKGPRGAFYKRFNRVKSSQHEFYDMDYQDYFAKQHSGEIGFYIYDGEHGYENQYNGLKAAEQYFADECLIMVDDVNKKEPRDATLDFIRDSENKYEIIFDEKTAHNGHPTWWDGVMIFQKK